MTATKRTAGALGAALGVAASVVIFAGGASAAPYTNGPTVSIDISNPGVGAKVKLSGRGMAPNERVRIELHSTPVLLDTVLADALGAYTADVQLPSDASCQHELVSIGQTSGRTVKTDIVIGDPANCPGLDNGTGSGSGGSSLPKTGAQILGIGLLGAALVGGGITLRRRSKVNA